LILLGIICGISGIIQYVGAYTAQRHVEAGITTLVLNLYTPVAIILASLFLNEKLTPMQLMGTFLLLAGMIIVSKKHRIGRFKFDKYFLLMVVSGIFLGVMVTAERALQKLTGFTGGTMISWYSQFIFLALATILTKSKSHYTVKQIGLTGSLRFFQGASWVVLVFIVGNLSVVSAVTTFRVVLIFIAAALFLKEREDWQRKTVGSLVALAGLLMM
jgi:drug/metabolite transporter (DMT)-like permease